MNTFGMNVSSTGVATAETEKTPASKKKFGKLFRACVIGFLSGLADAMGHVTGIFGLAKHYSFGSFLWTSVVVTLISYVVSLFTAKANSKFSADVKNASADGRV